MGSPLPTRPTPAPRKPGEELGIDDKDSRRTGFGHTSRGSDDLISGTGSSKPPFTSTHSRKPFGNDHDAFSSSTSDANARFSHFISSNRDDDDKNTSTTPRIDRFSFNKFGLQRDTNATHRNDRNDRGFGRTGGDDTRRDRDDNKLGTTASGRPRFGAKDGDEGGWNTVTRPRKSFGHNDDGDKFRREHGRTAGDSNNNKDRDNKDRTNRYEPFSKDRTDRDRDGERTNVSSWKDRDHNKRQGGKAREEGSWFLTDEERAIRNAIKEKEFREQRERNRDFGNGGPRHNRDHDQEHRPRGDRETFGDSKNFGRGFERQEKEPEWMDSTPGDDGKEFKAHSTEEFQRWKAAMKAKNQPQPARQQPQPVEEKPAAKEQKDEEIVFKSKAEKRATALEEAQAEPIEEPPTPSVAENGVDRFWGWNASSTSLASKTASDGGAKLPSVSSGEKTPAVERSSRFRNFFNAPAQEAAELPPAPAQNGNQEQLMQLQAQQVQQIHQQHQILQKQLGQAQQIQQAQLTQQQQQQQLQQNVSQYQQYQNQLLQHSNPPQPSQASVLQQQQQAAKDKHLEAASKEDREGFNNILQMLGRARLSSPPNAEAQNAFLSILGAPSQQGTPVSHTHSTPPASHPSNNPPGPPPQQPQQSHSNINRLPSGLQSAQVGSGNGNESILKLLRHSDMPTPQGPPPPPPFLQDYHAPNGPPVSISPPAVQRGKNSASSALNDPAIRAIGRPGDGGPPGLPKNLYHEPPQHVRSPSQILEAHHRGFPGMDIRPPPGMDRNTPLEAQKANFLNEQPQRAMDPRHLELLQNEQRRRLMEQQMQMNAASVQDLQHRNFPPNPPPRMEQRGPPQPQGPPNTDQGPPMGLPGMGGENGQIPGNWAPGPQQHPSQQNQSGLAGNANQQRPPPGFFQRGPGGPPGPANGGNVNGPGGPGGPMPPLPFYGPGPGLGNMPPIPFGQHGMPPPPNMPNMPNMATFPFPPPGPGGPPPMPPQGFPPFPFHEGMMPFGAGPDGLRSPQHQHLGGAPPGMFSGR